MKKVLLSVCACFCAALFPVSPGSAGEAPGHEVFRFELVETQVLNGWLSTAEGEKVTVDWGDGTRREFSGAEQSFSKGYDGPVTVPVVFYGESEGSLRAFHNTNLNIRLRFDLDALPGSLEYLRVWTRESEVGGKLSDLPRGMTYFHCAGLVTASGAVRDLPQGLAHFTLNGPGADFSGDIMNLPPGIESFSVPGANTLRGDLRYLPRDLKVFECRGGNTIEGNVADLPEGLERFDLIGSNTVTGDLADLPRGLVFLLAHGQNTLGGNLDGLPPEIAFIDILGANTVSGEITGLPPTLARLRLYGRNTISGNLEDLPENMTEFRVSSPFNTVTGNIARAPARLGFFEVSGAESGRGISYEAGREWPENMIGVKIVPARGSGLDTASVDALINDLSRTTWTGNLRRVELLGGNAPRSSASDEAVEKLKEINISVLAN